MSIINSIKSIVVRKKQNLTTEKVFTEKEVKSLLQRSMYRAYAGALGGRKMAGWYTSNSSQDEEVFSSFEKLRERARSLGRDNPSAISFLRTLKINVIGLGIRLQATIKDDKGNNIAELNRKIEQEFSEWSRMENIDVRGMLSFNDIENMVLENLAETGESPIVRFIYEAQGDSKIKLSLQVIEADHLDINYNVESDGKSNEIRKGVEINSRGRPVAYWLFERHPGDKTTYAYQNLQFKRIRVPAEDIIFFFAHKRPGQTRAVTWLASVITTVRQLGEYLDATAMRKKIEAAIMYFIKSAPSTDLPAGAQGPLDTDTYESKQVIDVEAGAVYNLDEGEDVVSPPIQPSTSDASFISTSYQNVAAGTGSSMETVSKDYSKTNYSSSRLSLMAERDYYKTIQKIYLHEFARQDISEISFAGYVAGVFDFKNYWDNKSKYHSCKWMPRGFDWVDPKNDVEAELMELENGLQTYSEALASRGKDFEETVLQLKKEQEFMKLHGITPSIFAKKTKEINQAPNSNNQSKGD